MKGTGAAVLAALCLCYAPPVTAATIEQTVEQHRNDLGEIDRRGDEFFHRNSGYVFASRLGDMPARKTYTYGPDNVSVYYTLHGGGNGDPWLSLYVYKSGQSLEWEVDEIKQALLERMPGSAIARPAGLSPAPSYVREQWFKSTVEAEAVTTGYRIARDGDWTIKVRVTVPERGGQYGLDRAWRALAAVRWSTAERQTSDPMLSELSVSPEKL